MTADTTSRGQPACAAGPAASRRSGVVTAAAGRSLVTTRPPIRRVVLAFCLLVVLVVGAPAAPSASADDSPYLNVWVHYDYMVGPGYSDAPSAAAMQMVVDAFKAHGVTLHIDPQHAAIPGQAAIVPDWQSQYASTPGFDDPSCTGTDAVLFSSLKAQYFHPSSNHPWHYAIFGNDLFSSSIADVVNCPRVVENGSQVPSPSMYGYSQVGFLDVPGGLGYDLLINMEVFRDIGYTPTDVNVAALFMHELGHNLGLCHGGPNLDRCSLSGSGQNYKPNYISVMNYFFEFGIPYAATPGSTTMVGKRADYSDVTLPDLNETCLNETVGVQDTVHPTDITRQYAGSSFVPVLGPVDWNNDGNTTDTCIQRDLDGDVLTGILHGADDWAWIHSRLTPPAITSLTLDGTVLSVSGVNLMEPATVIFSGGAAALGHLVQYDMSPKTTLAVTVPAGAKSGPVTIVTPEGTAVSSQSVTINATAHGPNGITAGPDGNLWFTEADGNAIGRITPAGQVSEFPLPTPSSYPDGITAGPDGNLWFTEEAAGKIGRISPAGKVTEFPLPPTPERIVAQPEGITAGPDGALWFTETNGNVIGRITPAGTVTQFPLPTPASRPIGITAGPDGNLWFTERGGTVYTGSTGNIGRITTAGTITEFPVPNCGVAYGATLPREITTGPDGNLWFTGECPGQITPAGTITAAHVGDGSITVGPDGNLWFTDFGNIGRITPSGMITEFPVPGDLTSDFGIAAGPDGNLWFTELPADRIGLITTSGQIIEFSLP